MLRQRQPRYLNRKLLDTLHEAPCMARFPHVCNGPSVPAHSNSLSHGRGHGHKSHDCFTSAVCPEAHDYLDGRKGGWDEETKRAEWERSYVETQIWLWQEGKVTVK